MKRTINVMDYATEIMKALSKGVLMTTKDGEKVNTMTIAWGALGIEWSTPIFTAYVRENRFTKTMLEHNAEFTINIPMGDFDKKILGYCGTKSGKNIDKIKDMNLSLVDSNIVNVPGIKELPLTLECRVIYKQLQDKNEITKENVEKFYPSDVDGDYHGANKDYHIVYQGEIVDAYIIE